MGFDRVLDEYMIILLICLSFPTIALSCPYKLNMHSIRNVSEGIFQASSTV